MSNLLVRCLLASSLLLSSLLIAGTAAAAGPVVLVQHNEQFYGYMTLPRLSEVVGSVATTPALYWPAGRLYLMDAAQLTELEQSRAQLLQQLAELQQRYLQQDKPELAASTGQLQQQISSWTLARQQLMLLDPDLVRIKAELNPKLYPGQYLLQVTERPASLTVTGLAQNAQLAYRNATDAAAYTKELATLPGASHSFIYILPAGKPALVANTGIWNQQRQDIPPGAMLFVPFEQRLLPAGFADLNQQIVALLQHRVVL